MFKPLVFIGILFLASCSLGGFDGELIGAVESKTGIGDPSAEIYSETWLPKEVRKDLVEDLVAKVKNKELEVFNTFPGELTPMSKEDLEYIFFHVDTEYVEGDDGFMKPLPIEEEFDPGGIVSFKFKEELYYDKSNGSFQKKITHVCPMEQVYNEDGSIRGERGLFWVKLK